MKDDSIRMQIQRALDTEFSFLEPSPQQRSQLFQNITEGEHMKRTHKISLAMVIAIVLLLTAFTAMAAVLLSPKEVIEQNAVPLAIGNDTDVRRVNEYTAEELASLIRTANENGITLDETTGIMRALKKGEGYWEDEAIMEICREAFGGLYYEWTIEEKHWFGEIMTQTGYNEANDCPLPGKDDLTSEEARQKAVAALQAQFSGAQDLTVEGLYRREEWLEKYEEETTWSFTFVPLDWEHAAYSITLDKQGNVEGVSEQPQNWKEFTFSALQEAIYRLYRCLHHVMGDLTPEAWKDMRDRLPRASRDRSWTIEQDAYLASEYLLPQENDLTEQEAKAIAMKDAGAEDIVEYDRVLLGGEGKRIWKITFSYQDQEAHSHSFSWEIDSATGEILRKIDQSNQPFYWSRFILDSTFRQITKDMLTPEDALALAAEALKKELGEEDIPYADPAFFEHRVSYRTWSNQWDISYKTLTLQYASGACQITEPDHRVTVTSAAASKVNGDTLYQRYWQVYGGGNWPQEVFVRFAQDMAQYEPTTWEGKLLKKTGYPEESAARITKEQAVDIAAAHNDLRVEEELTSVLVGSSDHPIWKITLASDPSLRIYEIDGMTGDILDQEIFIPDNSEFDNPLKRRTLHRDFAPAYAAEYGAAQLAAVEAAKAFNNQGLDDPSLPLLDQDLYETTVDGATITFRSLNPEMESYRITFDENWIVEKAERF